MKAWEQGYVIATSILSNWIELILVLKQWNITSQECFMALVASCAVTESNSSSLVLDKFASKHHNVHMVTPTWEVHLATEMTESTFEQPIEC